MQTALFSDLLKLLVITLMAGMMGGVLVLAGQSVLTPEPLNKKTISETPGQDYIDTYKCKRAETKIIQFHGKEDNFSREGNEPANINPRLLENPFYQDLDGGKNKVWVSRDYDERGVDKFLIDHFDVPADITEGVLVVRARPQGSVATDHFALGDFYKDKSLLYEFEYGISFEMAMKSHLIENTMDVVAIPLSALLTSTPSDKPTLLSFLKSSDRSAVLDFQLQDDVMLDYAALILCQLPQDKKGATLTEFGFQTYGLGVNRIGCNYNKTQPMCDTIIGDQLCSVPTPLACYRHGEKTPPESKYGPVTDFVGGEVRLTKPVRGDRFQTYLEAVKFCQNEFGKDWRVLNFHESGGQTMTVRSDIPPNSRMWIDVIDQPHATCWSRE